MIAMIKRWFAAPEEKPMPPLGFYDRPLEHQWQRNFNLSGPQRSAAVAKGNITRARNRSMSKGGGNG